MCQCTLAKNTKSSIQVHGCMYVYDTWGSCIFVTTNHIRITTTTAAAATRREHKQQHDDFHQQHSMTYIHNNITEIRLERTSEDCGSNNIFYYFDNLHHIYKITCYMNTHIHVNKYTNVSVSKLYMDVLHVWLCKCCKFHYKILQFNLA